MTIEATDATAAEAGADTGTFTVTRTGGTSGNLVVSLSVTGSATSGTDYTGLSGGPTTVTILAGQSSKTITITPVDDTAVEGSETVVAEVVAGTGYTVGTPSSATVTIADNDSGPGITVSITATDASASETGPDPGTFVVSRTGGTSGDLVVSLSVTGSATAGTDYSGLSGGSTTVTIPNGQGSTSITITPIDDTAVEGSETVVTQVVAGSGYTVGSPSSATVTIADNDSGPPPTPSLSINDVAVIEGHSGTTSATFTVSLSQSSSQTVTVSYATAGGSATPGVDYTSASGTVTFDPGQTSKPVPVQVIGDTEIESKEAFFVNLSNPANATILDGQGLGTILDDDSKGFAPLFSFKPPLPSPTPARPTQPLLLVPDVKVRETDGASSGGQAARLGQALRDPVQSFPEVFDPLLVAFLFSDTPPPAGLPPVGEHPGPVGGFIAEQPKDLGQGERIGDLSPPILEGGDAAQGDRLWDIMGLSRYESIAEPLRLGVAPALPTPGKPADSPEPSG